MKEAAARIKINRLLEAAGWRFFADDSGAANIQLEPNVTLRKQELEVLGDNFQTSAKGFVDFLLLDAKGFPLIVLEAKAEDKNPLIGKEQRQPRIDRSVREKDPRRSRPRMGRRDHGNVTGQGSHTPVFVIP